jgi:hypothetical protein
VAFSSNLGEINLGECNLGDLTAAGETQQLAAAVTCGSTAAAALQVARRLAGLAAGVSSVTAALSVGLGLRATVACTSTCQAALYIPRSLAGLAAGASVVTAALSVGVSRRLFATPPTAGQPRLYVVAEPATARVFGAAPSGGMVRVFKG